MTWEIYGVGLAHSLVGPTWQDVGSRNRAFRPEDLRSLRRQGLMGHSFYLDEERTYDVVIPEFEEEHILCAYPGCENKRRPTTRNPALYCIDHAVPQMRPMLAPRKKKVCRVPECGRPVESRGLCSRCYQRSLKGSPQWTPNEGRWWRAPVQRVITITIYDHRKV